MRQFFSIFFFFFFFFFLFFIIIFFFFYFLCVFFLFFFFFFFFFFFTFFSSNLLFSIVQSYLPGSAFWETGYSFLLATLGSLEPAGPRRFWATEPKVGAEEQCGLQVQSDSRQVS